ncbi:hypothetical protein FOL46_000639 [Perkinsus olseni]|uniref:Uncharacterized protein n=1 Tax=Perkinsus olseni TaxID=32597 RepID=A0A7J6KWE8_PEROL|nr:hypothetical protein FOL46_000639 [Perkinsus olseni]
MSTTSTCVSKLIAIGVTLLVGTSMLEGCSDSDSEVPAPRTRKRGSDILGCDIYLGEKSPFTVATYESSGSGNFTLLYRECTELQNASLAGPPTCKVTLTSASDPPQKVDMQYEDPNVFVAAATTCPDGSTAPLPAGVNVTAGIACKDLKKKAESAETFEKFMAEASLDDATLTYRTVSIYVRDLDLSGSESPSFAQLGRSEKEIRMRT